ncbi:MAG: hypothetical protein ACO3FE_14475, partial [Planctomycetaceae bacterium]
ACFFLSETIEYFNFADLMWRPETASCAVILPSIAICKKTTLGVERVGFAPHGWKCDDSN